MVLIDSSFDGGNIEIVDASSFDDIRLKIRKDTKSEFWKKPSAHLVNHGQIGKAI